jgi:hypothetical protein
MDFTLCLANENKNKSSAQHPIYADSEEAAIIQAREIVDNTHSFERFKLYRKWMNGFLGRTLTAVVYFDDVTYEVTHARCFERSRGDLPCTLPANDECYANVFKQTAHGHKYA